MTRGLAAAALVLATLTLTPFACARTRSVFVGSDVVPEMREPEPSGASAPTPPPDTEVADDADGAATGAAGAGGTGGTPGAAAAAGAGGSAPAPPPAVVADAGPSPDCAAGTGDCDGRTANGCETDVTGDRQHCGACGVACQTTDCACVDGQRVLACPSQRADCDADAANGCEVDLFIDTQHCGACSRVCSDTGAFVASATCSAGICVLTCSSPALRGDCDDDPDNGCETDLFHDADNCSACGMQCNACVDARCL